MSSKRSLREAIMRSASLVLVRIGFCRAWGTKGLGLPSPGQRSLLRDLATLLQAPRRSILNPTAQSLEASAMQLYQLPYSHHCSKVRIVALEKGIALELPPIPGGNTRSTEFLALNPMGQVPFLVDGDLRLAESEVIVEYLEEAHPKPAMLPASPQARARSRWLSRFHDLYLGKQLSTLYFALLQGKAEDPSMAHEVDELMRLLDVLESQVQPAPYFMGETFGLSDAAFALSFLYVGQLTQAYHRPVPARRIPKLDAWFAKVSQRPSVAIVFAECLKALAG